LHSASNAIGAPSTAETDASSVGDRSWRCWGRDRADRFQFQTVEPTQQKHGR